MNKVFLWDRVLNRDELEQTANSDSKRCQGIVPEAKALLWPCLSYHMLESLVHGDTVYGIYMCVSVFFYAYVYICIYVYIMYCIYIQIFMCIFMKNMFLHKNIHVYIYDWKS